MIHELIESKKKTVRSSAARSIKVLHDNKAFCDNQNIEQSDSENKEVGSSSTTFIPPWLRNSLGLNQRYSKNLDWSVCLPNFTALGHANTDQKSSKTVPRAKEENNNDESEPVKANNSRESVKTPDLLRKLSRNCETEVPVSEETVADGSTFFNNDDKAVSVFWSAKRKESETEANCPTTEIKLPRREDPKMTNSDVVLATDIVKLKDEERRRLRLIKQKNKIRKRVVNDHRAGDLGKNEVEFLLEMKAREVLDNYVKKDVHSVSSDMKQLEAKLILLSTKYHNLDGAKLSQQESRLLQEIKDQAGNKEDFDKLVENIKGSYLKDVIRNSEGFTKSIGEKIRKYDDRDEKISRESLQNSRINEFSIKPNAEKDSVISTDDENDIKRFSEFLSKNKNMDEKRKCLEEVRNYFERKRRTRLTKRRYVDETKTPRQLETVGTNRKEEYLKERPRTKEVFTMSGRDRKGKFGVCDEEVVEKAVNETLQKFVDLYHFHVSPTVMGTMKKNILQAIQSDSLESDVSKQNVPVQLSDLKALVEGKIVDKPLPVENSGTSVRESERKDQKNVNFSELKNVNSKHLLPIYTNKDSKVKNFKTVVEKPVEQTHKAEKESDGVENENVKRLKKEFEVFLSSIQNYMNTSGLRLLSISIEKEEQNAFSKNLRSVYNFTRKSLEPGKIDFEASRPSSREPSESKRKEAEIQTSLKTETIKKNAKCQTTDNETLDRSLQTDSKDFVSVDVQTVNDELPVKEIKELKGLDIAPGLYRMVKSKEAGRFFLYPEKVEKKSQALCCRSKSSVVKASDSNTRGDKRQVMRYLPREKRILFKDRDKLKYRKNKKGYVIGSNHAQKTAKKSESKNVGNSISCLYFGNFQRDAEGSTSRKNNDRGGNETLSGVQTLDNATLSTKDDHLGCVWFWNGEKINPGSDLKTHVEDLLKEKLKELSNLDRESSRSNRVTTNESLPSKDEGISANDSQLTNSRSSDKNLEIRNTNAIICFKRPISPEDESDSVMFGTEFNNIECQTKSEEVENLMTGDLIETADTITDFKSFKDVGTQNSQQTFLSLNITKLRSHSKTTTVAKFCKNRHRKRNLLVRPITDTQSNVMNFKKAVDVMKTMRKMKRLKLEAEKNTTPDSGSTIEISSSSSTEKNYTEDPMKIILGLKNEEEKKEMGSVEVKDKIKRIMTLVDHDSQTNELCNLTEQNSSESKEQSSEVENFKHWELIESVLNRVSQKERESLWNDIRAFIKTKIGRDINDEGAREVCIEIEQDVPKSARGKMKHAVLARGHYTRNEGDVEVEIDLTLDDLEKILHNRQRKICRRQIYHSSKTRRLFPSSPGPSDFSKDDLQKYQKFFQRVSALGGDFMTDKELKMLKKKTDN